MITAPLCGRVRPEEPQNAIEISPHQLDEFLNRNSRSPKNRSQGAAIQLLVIRDDYLGKRLVAAKNYVAPFLPPYSKANLPQRLYAITARDARKFVHTATRRVSNRSSGIAK